MEDAAYKLDA